MIFVFAQYCWGTVSNTLYSAGASKVTISKRIFRNLWYWCLVVIINSASGQCPSITKRLHNKKVPMQWNIHPKPNATLLCCRCRIYNFTTSFCFCSFCNIWTPAQPQRQWQWTSVCCVICGALNKLTLSVSLCVFYYVYGVQLVKGIVWHFGKFSYSHYCRVKWEGRYSSYLLSRTQQLVGLA